MSAQPNRPGRVDRGDALDDLAQRSRDSVAARLRRVRLTALPIVQSALGAAVAWWLASTVIDHEQPFFAPIAALITLGGGLGQRLPRVLELTLGVAVGVLVGDLLVAWIGVGLVQVAAVVILAMLVAVFVGSGPVLISQAGSSAVLVVTLLPPEAGPIHLDRFVDALVGGGVGLVVGIVLLPLNPVSAARRQVDPLLGRLAELLEQVAAALAHRDRSAATRALLGARQTQVAVTTMHTALEAANEVARIAPVRWHKRGQLAGYLEAAVPLDHLSRNTRVLCRHVISVLRRDEPVPPMVAQALRALAGGLRLLRLDLEKADEPRESRASAVAAANIATEALEHTSGFSGQVVVAQLRSLALDLLAATGLDRDEAVRLLPGLPEGPVSYGRSPESGRESGSG